MKYRAIFSNRILAEATLKKNRLIFSTLETDLSGNRTAVTAMLRELFKFYSEISPVNVNPLKVSLKKHSSYYFTVNDHLGKSLASLSVYNDLIFLYINLNCSIEEHMACSLLFHDKFVKDPYFIRPKPTLFNFF